MNDNWERFEIYTVDEFIRELANGWHLKTGYGVFMRTFFDEKEVVPDIDWVQANREDYRFIKWYTGETI